jgi:hypothetical protein
MYKKSNGQVAFEDFNMPNGFLLDKSNRWVTLAESIPWDEFENKYAQLFPKNRGNVAKPFRLAFGALMLQNEYNFSDVEVAMQIKETPALQYFCGLKGFSDEMPFDPSLMVHFRTRLDVDMLKEINEAIIQKALRSAKESAEDQIGNNDGDNQSNGASTTEEENPQESIEDGNKAKAENEEESVISDNNGTLIIDATCAPVNIKFPTDTGILNEAREDAESLIDVLHKKLAGQKPRSYRKKAHKEFVSFTKNRKPSKKLIRKTIKKQLSYLKRDLKSIDKLLLKGGTLTKQQDERLDVIKTVYQQQLSMYTSKTHKVENRIVSISQPHIRPIVRGKANAPTEFGPKLDISVVVGYTRLETVSFESYNEATKLIEIVERYKELNGCYPKRILADKIYRNTDNLNYCKTIGATLSGPKLGRPKKETLKIDKKQEYTDAVERIEVERRFSLSKRKCGMSLIMARLQETQKSVLAMSIIVLNLKKIQHTFFAFLQIWFFHLRMA